MSTNPPALPRNFDHWLGPWRVGLVCWIAGDVFDDDNLMVERDVWVRDYQEQSHCDTPGCCEMKSFILGPHVSGIRVVSTEDTLPQPGVPTINLLVDDGPGWQTVLSRLNPFSQTNREFRRAARHDGHEAYKRLGPR